MKLETFKTRKGADKRCAELRRMWPDKTFQVWPQPSGFLHCIALLNEHGAVAAYVQKAAPLKSVWAKLKRASELASDRVSVWAIENGHGHTGWGQLQAVVPAGLWQAWLDASRALAALEDRAVRAGKAWRGPYSALNWYR